MSSWTTLETQDHQHLRKLITISTSCLAEALTQEVIVEAIQFRQKLSRLSVESEAKGSWFFWPWNAYHGID